MSHSLLSQLDGSGSDNEWQAIVKLRELNLNIPELLFNKFQNETKWQARSSCVYHATRYARTSNKAFQLGLLGLKDKSKVVRSRSCLLLAYSLRKDACSYLRDLIAREKLKDIIADALASIDAIENQNSDYFIDRSHSGLTKLVIN